MLQKNGTRIIALVNDAAPTVAKPVDAPVLNADRDGGYKPGMRDKKPVMIADVVKKPSMITDLLSGQRTFDADGNEVEGLQWYHWLIIALLLAGIAYGGYYWYKKRKLQA